MLPAELEPRKVRPVSIWEEKELEYRQQGAPEEAIAAAKQAKYEKLARAATPEQIGTYFGIEAFDEESLVRKINENFKTNAADKEIKSWRDAFEFGMQQSVSGLAVRGDKPDYDPASVDTLGETVASMAGQVAGDAPAMVVGTVAGMKAGAAVGSMAGPVGAAVGAGVGAYVGGGGVGNALPEFLRASMMEYYDKGLGKDFSEFWGMASNVLVKTTKAFGVGAVANVAGTAVTKAAPAIAQKVGPKLAPYLAGQMGTTAAEMAAATTAGAAFEGEAPSVNDFAAAAVLVGGLSGSAYVAKRALQKHYVKTGQHPSEVAKTLEGDPVATQEFVRQGLDEVYGPPDPTPLKAEGVELVGDSSQPKPAFDPDNIEVKLEDRAKGVSPFDDSPELRRAADSVAAIIGEKKEIKKKSKPFYQRYLDKFDAIKDVEKNAKEKGISLEESAYEAMSMVAGFAGKVKHFVAYGAINVNGEVVGKSFDEIVKPMEDVGLVKDAKAFLLANRAVALYIDRGVEALPAGLTDMYLMVKKGKKTFGQFAKDFTEWNNRGLEYARDSGLYSPEFVKEMLDNGLPYVSFARIFGGEDAGSPDASVTGRTKAVKGGDAPVKDPFDSAIHNMAALIKASDHYRAKNLVIKNLKDIGYEMKRLEVTDDMERAMFGDYAEQARVLAGELDNQITEETAKKVGKVFAVSKAASRDNQVMTFENGKRVIYEIDDPILAESIRAVEGLQLDVSPLIQAIAKATRVQRAFVTTTPQFNLRNAIRDPVYAFVSQGVMPWEVVSAMMEIIADKRGKKASEAYRAMLRSGGGNSGFIKIEEIAENYSALEKSGFLDSMPNIVKNVVEAIVVAPNVIESAPRLAAFKKASKGEYTGAGLRRGGYAASTVTLDYNRSGTSKELAKYGMMVNFLKVRMQGLDASIRLLDYKNPEFPKIMARASVLAGMSALIYLWNRDDPRHKAANRAIKDLNWLFHFDRWTDTTYDHYAEIAATRKDSRMFARIVTRDGKKYFQVNEGATLKVPKPQELGLLFGSIPERIAEAIVEQDPDAFKGLAGTVAETVLIDAVPSLPAPILEVALDRSFFTGNPIIPTYVEARSGPMMYAPHTSETGKALSKLIFSLPLISEMLAPKAGGGTQPKDFLSPLAIDHYVRGYFGDYGTTLLAATDAILKAMGVTDPTTKASKDFLETPFVRAFFTIYPKSGAQQIKDFDDRYAKAYSLLADYKALEGERKYAEARKLLADNKTSQRKLELIHGYKTQIENMQKAMGNIQAMRDPDGTPEEQKQWTPKYKRQLLDRTMHRIIEKAEMGIIVFDSQEDLPEDGAQ